jgi:hypothetical protein
MRYGLEATGDGEESGDECNGPEQRAQPRAAPEAPYCAGDEDHGGEDEDGRRAVAAPASTTSSTRSRSAVGVMSFV